MTRALAVLLLALSAVSVLAVACGDEDDFLLDEGEGTGTPSFLQRTPQATPEPSPIGSPLAEGATPVTPFAITADSNVNLRSEPSTEGERAGTLGPGDEKTVVAEIAGEEVTAGNDIWYQLEDGTFAYSGVVTKAGEGEEATATATPETTEEATQ